MKEVLTQIGKSEQSEKSEESFTTKAKNFLAENQVAALQRLPEDEEIEDKEKTPVKANPFISVKGRKKK